MRSFLYRMSNERGMVLFNALLVLSLLIAVGAGARVMVQNDGKISGNLRLNSNAFYLAEAGIEWSKDELSLTSSHPPAPTNRTQSFSSGTFAVEFLSAAAVTPLSARIVVRATGRVATASHLLQAQLTKSYDLADGAAALRGSASRVGFSGNAFLISGADHDPATAAAVAGAKPRPAITVAEEPLREMIAAGLDAGQQSNIVGGGDGGVPAISQSRAVPAAAATQLADDLCSSPPAISTTVPAEGVLSLEGQEWGTRSLPQLRCFEGLQGAGDAVRLGGNISGVGILVVRNAELIAGGSFHWEGLIIVTGREVGFTVLGSDAKEIYGSLTVNETGMSGSSTAILDLRGSVRLIFSRAALARITPLIPTATLNRAYVSLPFYIRQDYWRTVTP